MEKSFGFFVKQIIRDLLHHVLLYISTIYLTKSASKWIQFLTASYASQQKRSPAALAIFHNNGCLLELRGWWYLDTHALVLGPPGLS